MCLAGGRVKWQATVHVWQPPKSQTITGVLGTPLRPCTHHAQLKAGLPNATGTACSSQHPSQRSGLDAMRARNDVLSEQQ